MKPSLAALAISAAAAAAPAAAQDFYVGQIIMGGWNFCPRNTAPADGTLLAIASNTALFSLYGTQYGGDGRTTFALPDLRGRIAMHAGTGPGLSPRTQGQSGGAETVTLTTDMLPSHSHAASGTQTAAASGGNTTTAAGNLQADTIRAPDYATPGGPTVAMAPGAVAVTVEPTGGGQPVSVVNPFQVIRYCVVLFGIFPSRS